MQRVRARLAVSLGAAAAVTVAVGLMVAGYLGGDGSTVEAAGPPDHVGHVGHAALDGPGQSQIAQLRAALAPYNRGPEVAEANGWVLLDGLDHCFDNPGVGAMGIHYINPDLLDTTVEPLQPEALVYHHLPNGKLKLGAVEYIVPIEPWDALHDDLPQVFGVELHPNEALGVYVLHIWLFTNNPAGILEDWNRAVTCAEAD